MHPVGGRYLLVLPSALASTAVLLVSRVRELETIDRDRLAYPALIDRDHLVAYGLDRERIDGLR